MGLKLKTGKASVVSTTLVSVATIPHFFRCPISLDLMRDPVTLSTGQTYDRPSIEQWLEAGKLSCPVTRQPLSDLSLVPNHTLLRLIQNWCVANKSLGVERIPTPPQPVDSHHVSHLITAFSSSDSGRRQRVAALRRLRSLAKASDKNKLLIAGMGAAPLLISATFNEVSWSGEDGLTWNEVSEEAMGALVHLRPLEERYICELAQPSRLSFISHLINKGNMEARIHASSLIESMASANGASCDHLRSLMGETEGLIGGLVSLLHESHYPTCVKVGVRALFALCLSSSNWARATKARTPLELMECMLSLEKRDAERALATMELLCKTAEGREMVAGHAMAVPVLKKMMLKVSDQASECAAGILLAIASHSHKVQEEAVEEAIFTQLLLLLQSQCTCRAKKKARSLLKLLQDNWSQHPCIKVPGITGLTPF